MRAVIRCQLWGQGVRLLASQSTPGPAQQAGGQLLLCLVRWLVVQEDAHHEPTGMAQFEWEAADDGLPCYSLITANTIKCPIVLHKHATQPGVFVYNHFMD